MADKSDLCALGAVEAVRAMHVGDLRVEDYARALLDRAEDCRDLNAFVALDRDSVLEAARSADQARAAGASLGALHGLPIPVKDSVNTRAAPTTNGTRSLRAFRPREDADVLRPLFAAGAILLGKTNLQELSRGWTSNNLEFGPVKNPRDPTRIPGGSSGGSAAAVGAGIAPLAVAEDTWGSIRVPAAFCGVVGFRPTHGRYPNGGTMPLTQERFDQVGPLARSVADVALFDACVTGDTRPMAEVSLRGVRLGVPIQWLEGMDPDVERVVEEAFRRLEAAGAVLVRAKLPDEAIDAAGIATTIIGFENIGAISAFLEQQGAGVPFDRLLAQLSPNIGRRYETPPPTRAEYEAALSGRDRLLAAVAGHFESRGVAALVFPPCLAPAPPLGENSEVVINGAPVALRVVVGRNTALGPCARLSSLVLPAGMGTAGLPVSLEFDAPAGSDRALLALGRALEAALVA